MNHSPKSFCQQSLYNITISHYPLCEGDALILALGELLRDVLGDGVLLTDALIEELTDGVELILADGDVETEGVELTLVLALILALVEELACGTVSSLNGSD